MLRRPFEWLCLVAGFSLAGLAQEGSREAVRAGESRMGEERFEEALELFTEAAGAARPGEEAAEAHFHRGEALRALGRHEEALEAYDDVLRQRPPADLLSRTLQRKYQLGLDYLQGNADRYFLGIIPYSAPGFGVEILLELVRQHRYETFSDDALFSVANYYFRNEEWEEARLIYERLTEEYPNSEWVPPAYFQLGKAIYNGIKGYQYDPTPLVRARRYFERFLKKRVVGPEAEQARKYVLELRDMEAKYELYVGRFYLRNDHLMGARIHLEEAVKKAGAPEGGLTATGREAQELLTQLLQAAEDK